MLSYTLYYDGGARYNLPSVNQSHPLDQDQMRALTQLKLPYTVGQHITQMQIFVLDGHRLMTYRRHRYSHRMEAGISNWNAMYLQFTALKSESAMRVRFGVTTAAIQLKLQLKGHLRNLNLDVLF